jgi:hypothetical protein
VDGTRDEMTGCSSDDWILLVLLLHVPLITVNYNLIAILHNLYFTVAHALGLSVSTSRLLANDLNTGTSTSNHCEESSSLLQSPFNADPILRI